MKRLMAMVGHLLRWIGHEIAATIRFGAIPSAAAPQGEARHTDAASTVAGLGLLGPDDDREGNTD